MKILFVILCSILFYTLWPRRERRMFHNPGDRAMLGKVLKAYTDEWGPENITVSLPKRWKHIDTKGLPMKVEFTTEATMSIRAEGELRPGHRVEAMRFDYDFVLK